MGHTHKTLVIGDVHAVPDELEDCQKLIDGICASVVTDSPDSVIFLGDIHHTHSIVRVEVLNFWKRAFESIIASNGRINMPVYVLVGNHDMASNGDYIHSLIGYSTSLVHVVDERTTINGMPVVLIPYTADEQKFRDSVGDAKTVLCHQTFLGAQYENGFYATDGFSPEGLPNIISGHIHTPIEFANVWYVGAPRWRTVSDANINRSIWLLEFDESGEIITKKAIDTSQFCCQLVHLREQEPNILQDWPINPNWKYVVDIHGSEQFVNERKRVWAGKARIRTFVESSKNITVKESDGIEIAVARFFGEYKAKNGTDNQILLKMLNERVYGR